MRPRKPNWQKYFWAALQEEADKPFVWGERDCIMFTCKIVDSYLAEPCFVDMAKNAFVWSSIREAADTLRDQSMQQLIESVLGPPLPWQALDMGDIVLCKYDDIDGVFDSCLGVHDGTSPVVAADRNISIQQWSNAICGWKV
jgi:hypothetical protein